MKQRTDNLSLLHRLVPEGSSEREAVDNFLARYTNGTLDLYTLDLRIFLEWCQRESLEVLSMKRVQLERFGAFLATERNNSPRSVARRLHTVKGFYRLATADDLIQKDPGVMLSVPHYWDDPKDIAWLDRFEVANLLRAAEATSPAHHALIGLMGMLGLRVSEACNVRIEDYQEEEKGYRILTLIGKGNKPARLPIPIPLLRIMEVARGIGMDANSEEYTERTSGYLITTAKGNQQTRSGAYDWVKRLARKAGLPDGIHPHSLRHSAITAIVDSGAPLHVAQEFARHADPAMTEHYYRRKGNPDLHGAHIAARVFAGVV